MSSTFDHGEGILHLHQDTKRRISRVSGVVKSITEVLSDAVEKAKDLSFPEAIKQAVPWAEPVVGAAAETVGDVLPPVKFLLKLAGKIAEVNDPEELGHLACTVAFERAAEQAIKAIGGPVGEKQAVKDVKEQLTFLEPANEVDLGAFTYENAQDHEFFKRAELNLQTALLIVGYNGAQVDQITHQVKDHFVASLKALLTSRDTAEKFAPFKEYIELGAAEERQAYKALAEHATYQRWLFEDAPVLGRSPFALQHVYVETDCGKLTWGEINPPEQRPRIQRAMERQNGEQKRLDPFSEQDGGRNALVTTVMDLIGDAKLREPIIIQGIAGAGKSSFTLRLCVELLRQQVRPIRIRLKDLRFDRHVSEALPQAIKLSDEQRSPDGVPPTPEDLFRGGNIFKESGAGKYSKICRYVLILDGWDEISVANEGFRRRLERMLEQIRREYIDNTTLPYPVRIILTGRPSPDVIRSGFLREKTPILTIRPLTPDQLQTFIEGLASVVKSPPIHPPDEDIWPIFDLNKFEPVFRQYKTEFKPLTEEGSDSWTDQTQIGSLGALGLPLLAHLAARLISVWAGNPEQLITNATTLYRNLVNLTCAKGGKAEIDAEAADEIRHQSRIVGYELRDLLWQTAAAMTTYGKDLIPYEELSKRLKLEGEELDEQVDIATSKHTLSALLISFYFKGGVKHLGCEFIHKSFREYLFAEALVEVVKGYGYKAPTTLPERERNWKDFNDSDVRHPFSRELAQLLAPQWLSSEVIFHLDNLIKWEISRSIDEQVKEAGTATGSLDLEGWRRVRDGLADLWDWWGEGVHLRSQPHRGVRRELTYKPPYVTALIEHSLPFDSTLVEPQPLGTNTMDAHLGEGLFVLCEAVHYHLGTIIGSQTETSELQISNEEMSRAPRMYQSQGEAGGVRFAPSKPNEEYFLNYINRINSAGWRPMGVFPEKSSLRKVDLSGATLYFCIFEEATLTESIFDGANLYGSYWSDASLEGASFNDSRLNHGSFYSADLSRTTFNSTTIYSASFESAQLDGATFVNARIVGTSFDGVSFRKASFKGATLRRSSFRGAHLEDIDIEGTTFEGVNFEEARLIGVELSKARGISDEQLAQLDLSNGIDHE